MRLHNFRIVEPFEGSITIDDIDISKIDLKELRKSITIILQDPLLFSGSVRFNLDPSEEHADAEIWKILEICGLKEFCTDKAEGLSYKLNKGENISLGQKQLFCLARALLTTPKILILDEATSSLDPVINDIIHSTIKSHCNNLTVIEIVHSLKSTLESDRILVMESGNIIENDTPQNLIKDSQSKYYQFMKESNLIADQ